MTHNPSPITSYRIALIGAGHIAREHAISLAHLSQVRELSFFDSDAERAQKLSEEFGGRNCASLDELVENCDIVWICTPPFARREAIVAACRAGRPIFCEKPLAISREEMQWVRSTVEAAGVLFFMGQSNRFASFFVKMRELALDGAIGEITSIWSSRLGWLDALRTPSWRMDDNLGGGTIIELGVHEIDFIRWIGGEWRDVYAHGSSKIVLPEKFQDTVSALGTLESGASARIDLSWASPRYLWQRGIEGTRGSLLFDDSNLRVQLHRPGHEPENYSVDWTLESPGENPSLREQAKAIFNTLDTGATPPVTLHDGAQAIHIALAIRDSIEKSKIVTL